MLVSAFIADGPPSRLIEEAVAGRIALVLPDIVLEELLRVLRAKLGFGEERLAGVEGFLVGLATERLTRAAQAHAVTGDPADDEILATAVAARVDVIATGDRRHLLPVGERCGVRLLTPQALLAELRRR